MIKKTALRTFLGTLLATFMVSTVSSAAVLCNMNVKYHGRQANPLMPKGYYRVSGTLGHQGFIGPHLERRVIHDQHVKWLNWGKTEGGSKITVSLEGKSRRHKNIYSLRLFFSKSQNGTCHLDSTIQGWS